MRNHAAVLSLNLIHVWQGKEFVSILQVPAVVKKIIIVVRKVVARDLVLHQTARQDHARQNRVRRNRVLVPIVRIAV